MPALKKCLPPPRFHPPPPPPVSQKRHGWDRWRRHLEAWVLSDDVRYANGSINHTTEYAVLTAAGISPADAATLQHHDRALEVHMGGADGRSPSSTRLGAGTGQGCPVSGMKYCIYGEVRGHEACRSVPPADTPAGPLNRVLLMDDTKWLPGDRCHLPALTSGIERAGRLTNLHSYPTKTVLVGTDMRDGWVHVLRDTVYLNGHPVRCATSQDYVRVPGRHAFPQAPAPRAERSAPRDCPPTTPSPCSSPSAMGQSTGLTVSAPPPTGPCGCLQAIAVRRTRNERGGPGCHPAPLRRSAQLPRSGVAKR